MCDERNGATAGRIGEMLRAAATEHGFEAARGMEFIRIRIAQQVEQGLVEIDRHFEPADQDADGHAVEQRACVSIDHALKRRIEGWHCDRGGFRLHIFRMGFASHVKFEIEESLRIFKLCGCFEDCWLYRLNRGLVNQTLLTAGDLDEVSHARIDGQVRCDLLLHGRKLWRRLIGLGNV